MTVTTACYESWPMMVFWTWMSMAAGIALYLIIGGYTRPYFKAKRANATMRQGNDRQAASDN